MEQQLNELRDTISDLQSQLETERQQSDQLRALSINYRDKFRALARQLSGADNHV